MTPKNKKNRNSQREMFHPSARQHLEMKLKDTLEKTVLRNGIVDNDLEDWGYPFITEMVKHRKDHLTSGQIWTILFNHICHEFIDVTDKQKSTGKLPNLVHLGDLASKIINFYESIPRQYSIYVDISSPYDSLGSHDLSENISIIQIEHDSDILKIKQESKRFSTLKAMATGVPEPISVFSPGRTVLRIRAKGFAYLDPDHSALSSALSYVKTIFYLGRAFKIFEKQGNWVQWTEDPIKNQVFITDDTAGEDTARVAQVLESTTGHIASHFFAKKNNIEVNGKVIDHRLHGLQMIAKLLEGKKSKTDRTSIVTAAEWAFESSSSHNQTVSFIQLCIALEALLGEEAPNEGLSRMLSDRCAYMLGETYSQRKVIRNKFNDLYTHRSKLVHGRKTSLDEESAESLHWGQKILSALLRKELKAFNKANS
jgi:hypothetical protein